MKILVPHSRPTLGKEEAAAAAAVVRSGRLSQGREAEALEAEAARFLGVRGAVAVSSGTAALFLTLKALGAGPGREVVLPSFACSALAYACRMAGVEPVLSDVNWHDMNISVSQVRRRLTHRTAAVVAVHSFGAPAELEPLLALGVPVIEDAAQALGAQDYNGRKLGGLGTAGIFSFYSTKMIAAGEGGLVVSHDRRILDSVRDMRDYDQKPMTDASRFNFKMTDIQAAVARVQLKRLPGFLAARRKWAAAYREAFRGAPLELPLNIIGHVYHRFVAKASSTVEDGLLESFARLGVAVRRPVFRPLHWDMSPPGRFPVADRAWRRSLSIPLYPSLTTQEFQRVVRAVEKLV